MFEEFLMFEEIEVEVSGFFTTHHWFNTDTGTWAELLFPAFAGYGSLRSPDGREILMQKSHWLGSGHEYLDEGNVRGTADRGGLLRQDIDIEFDGEHYRLEPEGLFSQGWFLLNDTGTRLLEMQPRGVFKQGAYLAAHGVVSAHLAAFVYYLVHVRQQESAAVVAATAS